MTRAMFCICSGQIKLRLWNVFNSIRRIQFPFTFGPNVKEHFCFLIAFCWRFYVQLSNGGLEAIFNLQNKIRSVKVWNFLKTAIRFYHYHPQVTNSVTLDALSLLYYQKPPSILIDTRFLTFLARNNFPAQLALQLIFIINDFSQPARFSFRFLNNLHEHGRNFSTLLATTVCNVCNTNQLFLKS